MIRFLAIVRCSLVASLFLLAACGGGGGGGSTAPAATYTIGGTVTGLSGTGLVLQNNGGDNLSVAASGTFTFAAPVAGGANYAVTVFTRPTGQVCTVNGGTGTVAGANVTNVGVNCVVPVLMGGATNAALNLTGIVSSFTGTANTATASGAADGASTAASFNDPFGVTSDGTNLYVADTVNNTIRKIVIATGAVSTLAGTAGSVGATDGTGTAALFNWPMGITTDGTNLYVTDSRNNKIRKIVIATGVVSSVTGAASKAMAAGATDGAAMAALFNSPIAVATDGTNLYVVDQGNNKIRQVVIATGAVSSLTGAANAAVTAGAADGAGAAASFDTPSGVTTDGASLYVADKANSKIRKVDIATGVVSSLTGTANTVMATGAADGAAAAASFWWLGGGITTDGTNLFVVDTSNAKIRKIVLSTGIVSSLTGTANTAMPQGAADGAATSASFSAPWGITTDGFNLYVADGLNNKIRKIQ